MREIPFDPNDPQAALRPATAPQQAFDPTAYHAQSWHSVAPPGFVPPPITPANGGARPTPMTAQDEAAAFLAMPTNSASHRSGTTAVADALMSTTTGRRSVGTWAAADLAESSFGFVGYGLALLVSAIFGGNRTSVLPPMRPRRSPRIR